MNVLRREHRLVLRRPDPISQTMFNPLLAPTQLALKVDLHSKRPSQGMVGFVANAIIATGRGVSSSFPALRLSRHRWFKA